MRNKMLLLLLSLLAAVSPAGAELLQVELSIFGMD
jgi:hypothetical protein